jgi:hypothetical protein
MPMYFPDLKSVKQCAEIMSRHKGDKKYNGIIPKKEEDLPKARYELGQYFRNVWNDTIQALEIELSVNEQNYDSKIKESLLIEMFKTQNTTAQK